MFKPTPLRPCQFSEQLRPKSNIPSSKPATQSLLHSSKSQMLSW
jgi:hypothetical protein